ncbi:MAG: hypothetical protein ACTSPL_04095 [Candidatus Odinarchaeia archaeon]
MIKILWEPQISSIDKRTGKFLESDSNVSFMLRMIEATRSFAEIHPIIPSDLHRLILRKNVKTYYIMQFEKDPMRSRFLFDKDFWETVLKLNDYNLIFLNDPTHVAQVKCILKKLHLDVPIATYNHWIARSGDLKFEVSPIMRQIEGQIYADIIFTNSEAAKRMILEQMLSSPIRISPDKIKILPPPAPKIKRREKRNSGPIFLYNNRLSFVYEYQVSLHNFILILKNLKTENVEFKVIFTNPSGYSKRQLEEMLRDVPMQYEVSLMRDYEQYYNFIANNKCVSGVFFNHERIWSISLLDVAMGYNPIIAPSHSCFKEMFREELCYKSLSEAEKTIKMLFTDGKFYNDMAQKAYEDAQRFTPKKVGEIFKEAIKDVCGGV